ncbi:SDR family NAD(P)-dependent oxidoreductase [Myxococcaceae bacterium JPH2]|nr:SDR family NAD(P)-dependent oxidoreductase [Myxococcaceae bacterium JPH2]
MRPPIDNSTVLIVGAADGLGPELARLLARRVRTLVLVASRISRLEPLRTELRAANPTLGVLLRTCNFCDAADVDALLGYLEQRIVRVDVLINIADMGAPGLFAQEQWERLRQTLRSNIVVPALIAHRLVPGMVARGRGGILNVGSGASHLLLPGASVFAGTQRFVDGFTEALRLELEGTGVTVTQVAPGPLDWEPPLPDECTPLFHLSARRGAREALAGFERGAALVYPGAGHRWVMRVVPRLPRWLQRGVGRLALRGVRARMLLTPPTRMTSPGPPMLLASRPEPA